jgi:hypothetical protein
MRRIMAMLSVMVVMAVMLAMAVGPAFVTRLVEGSP